MTMTELHADLERAYRRASAALDAFSDHLERVPGTSSAAKPAPKPAKPKPRKPKASVNGHTDRFPVADVPGAGF